VSDGGNPAHFKLTNYKFKNLVLDLDHGYSGNDVTVFSFDDNNGDNQRWEAAPLQADGDSISGAAAAMVAQWQLKCPQMSNIYNSDAEYAYGDLHELQAIWMKSYLNPRNPDHVTYKKDVFDCDDFALAMKAAVAKQCYADLGAMACSIGIVWTYDSVKHSGHAFNVFLDKLWQVKLFEPQTGQLYYMTPSEKTLFVMF